MDFLHSVEGQLNIITKVIFFDIRSYDWDVNGTWFQLTSKTVSMVLIWMSKPNPQWVRFVLNEVQSSIPKLLPCYCSSQATALPPTCNVKQKVWNNHVIYKFIGYDPKQFFTPSKTHSKLFTNSTMAKHTWKQSNSQLTNSYTWSLNGKM